MKKCLITLSVLILLTQFGCNSPDAFDCIKKTGTKVEEEIILGEFEKIAIYDGLQLNLVYGEKQEVIIKGGENLIPNVDFQLKEKQLTITDDNGCNWVRDYEPIVITITSNRLIEVRSGGYGLIKSINTLNFDQLLVESKDGSGDFELDVAVDQLRVVNNSFSNIYISGLANYLSIGHWYNDGRFNGTDLEINNVGISHNGVNDIYIRVKEKLSGELTSRGNIIYFGNPEIVEVNVSGTGQLINKQ